VIKASDWGLKPRRIPSPAARGAYHFDPVLKTAADAKKLRHPQLEHDKRASVAALAFHEELLGDILTVRQEGRKRVSFSLMWQYTELRGLTEMMTDLFLEPNLVHDIMSFFVEGHLKILDFYERNHLLSHNNDGTYHSTGGKGWTFDLPQKDSTGKPVRLIDMWGSAEAQELAQVGPEHHEEFALRYEKKLLSRFGLNGYGCRGINGFSITRIRACSRML